MKRILIAIALVFVPVFGIAQAKDWTNRIFIDSLTHDVAVRTGRTEMWGNIPSEPYKPIRDSILRLFVQDYIHREAVEGRYIWPWHSYQTEGRNGVPKLTPTWAYMLKTFYEIRPSGLYIGCFGIGGMEVHDSFMKAAIEEKHGDDFFQRLQKTADSLDGIGQGLNLPYIAPPNSKVDAHQFTLTYLDSLMVKELEKGSFEEWILVMEFVDGRLKYSVPIRYWEYKRRHTDRSLRQRAKRYTKQARSMPWVGPKYAGKSISATVAYHFRERHMWFFEY